MKVRGRRLSGGIDWLCIHIEIQVSREPRFARRMYVYNYRISDWDAAMVREFFLVIDWMMTLPHGLAAQLSTFVTDIEEEQKMEYISSVERYRTEQAQLQGKLEGKLEGKIETMQGMLGRLLKRHFGEVPAIIEARIKNASGEQIDAWFDRAIAAKSLEEVFQDAAHQAQHT